MNIYLEFLGYLGTVLIAASLMMSSIGHLRKINLIGASTFATYGLLTETYPVFILNSFISAVDIFYLVKMRRQVDFFELFEIKDEKAPFLNKFLSFYNKDIKAFFPGFKKEQFNNPMIIFILRNMMPVGLFIVNKTQKTELEIILDYVIPSHRDLKNAHYLYHSEHDLFCSKSYQNFIIKSQTVKHTQFLEKMGFKRDRSLGENWYKRPIAL